MKLLTKAIVKSLPPLYSQDGKGLEAVAKAKFFCPWGGGTWYATEYNPEERLFFGLVTGLGTDEQGYFSLDELESVRGPAGLRIERDINWRPRPLKECK